jgi:hypothetical protein
MNYSNDYDEYENDEGQDESYGADEPQYVPDQDSANLNTAAATDVKNLPSEFQTQAQSEAPRSGNTSTTGIMSDFSLLANAAQTGDAVTILSAMENFSKSQMVRFLDITVIGPLLMWWAFRGKLSVGERTMMGLIGAGTLVYNFRHYMGNKQGVQPEAFAHIKSQLQDKAMSGYYRR